MNRLVNRFLTYVKIDTQSDPTQMSCPSTEKQKNLSRLLVDELHQMGYSNAFLDDDGYVYAKIEGNDPNLRPIGLIAHVDTSFDAPGSPVNPRIINHYQGDTIVLNEFYNMHPNDFPSLSRVIGDDIIVTDGHTLLGADDKCGVAEIMELAERLKEDTTIQHGDLYICFTPDEEIGRGADRFNYNYFKADYAYTLDGSEVGGIEYENFNAASAIVTITGKSIHPGSAKNKMVNALQVAMTFNEMLPQNMRPEHTEKREGFNHLTRLEGEVERATMQYIIRNHDKNLFEAQKSNFIQIQQTLNEKYGYHAIDVTLKDSYYNMYEKIKDRKDIIKRAENAIKACGITPFTEAIRGGTDGARLTYEGLLCPNLGTGGYHFHGRYEFASIQQMEKTVDILIHLVQNEK
jgi:tripeptide aminopeptidase